jgi:hypothetical protein
MTNSLLEILAHRNNLTIDTRWNGYRREWIVKDSDGVQLFTTTEYDNLVTRLEEGEGLKVGSYPPKWWPR